MSSGGSRLDPWVDAYASRANAMRASEIRALFAVASRPEVVSLAGGMPYVQALPVDMLVDTARRILHERGATALQYGSGQGDVTLREQILEVIAEVGISAHPDDIVVTPGSQMALDLVTRVFCDPGDVVLVESPSYVGALGVFQAYECDVVHVAMDDEGLVPTALEEAITSVRAAGKRIKLIYTIPSFHNPAGVTQGQARRSQLLAIAQREGIAVLEDDPYGLLGFEGEAPRAIRADDPDGVIYLGSFSKTIASGLRVGWAVAPHGVREKLVLAAEAAILCPSNYTQLHHFGVPGDAALAGAGQDVSGGLPGAARRPAGVTAGAHARGHHVDDPPGWLLLLAHAPARPRRDRHAAPRGRQPGGLRPRHGLLRRRAGSPQHAAVLLLPRARSDP